MSMRDAIRPVFACGTNRSTGCVDEGAASDILSVKAVVDWLNGRADAVDSYRALLELRTEGPWVSEARERLAQLAAP